MFKIFGSVRWLCLFNEGIRRSSSEALRFDGKITLIHVCSIGGFEAVRKACVELEGEKPREC